MAKHPLISVFFLLILSSCSNGERKETNDELGRRFPSSRSLEHSCSSILANLSSKRSFLYDNLLKQDQLVKGTVVPTDDLDEIKRAEIQVFFKGKTLLSASSLERFNLLKRFPIGDISAAPGHRYLRKPEQIKGLVDYIAKNPKADFGGDKIILNIVTDPQGKIESVDLWNAHHRLVAYLENGYSKIGDIPQTNIEILINGAKESGEKWVHYLPAAGVDWKQVSDFTKVPVGGDIREGTIAVSGNLSNYYLGARNTLSQLHKNVFNSTRKRMKVGVYFGTFDPIHEGHVSIIKKSLEALGLDEVLIVPNVNPIHKSPSLIEHRNAMIAIRVKDEVKINLYTGNSDEIIDKFGRNPFFERMIQIYGSTDLYQIIGDDSYSKLVASGEIELSNFRKYIVFPRKGSNIPLVNSEKVIVVEDVDETGLSSTRVRQVIKSRQQPKETEISNEEYLYILKHNLYDD